MTQGRVRRADARRVLARGRGPGRRRGPGHAAAGRGLLAARGLLRPHARHAPRLQQRVHAHAPGRGQRGLPAGHQGDPRVRPRDPQALRQLHEQPGREDRASSSSARATSTSAWPRCWRRCPGLPMFGPRPGRGLRREVRHGVPPRDARRAAGRRAGRAARARDLPAAPPARLVRRGATTSCSTTSSATTARSTRTSSPTRTESGGRARWSSTTTASATRPARSAIPCGLLSRGTMARSRWGSAPSPTDSDWPSIRTR